MEMSDCPGKGCSFCKIMFFEISLHEKITIPEKFVRKYGKQLGVGVLLKVPGGAFWHVGLVGEGDKIWLQNGWPDFATFYSLCFGHFLVFKYQGNSQFDVFIYDTRCVEIDYPMDSSVSKRLFTEVRKRGAIDIDGLEACKKTRANSGCKQACHVGECVLQHKEFAGSASDEDLVSRLDGDIQNLDTRKPKGGEIDFNKTQQQGVAIINITQMVLESSIDETDSSGEDMTTKAEGTSASRWGLSRGFRMSKKGNITKALVIGLSAAAPGERGRHASCSRHGSKAIAMGKKGGLYLGSSTSDKGKAKALASAKAFKSKNPSFILTVRPSFIDGRSQVDIKRAFAQKYMRSNQNFEARLQANGKTWPVLCCAFSNRCRFGRGWPQFADGNSLSIGDVCVFELVNRKQKLLRVFIYRATKC